jgi:low affinity Fe/Cu permease
MRFLRLAAIRIPQLVGSPWSFLVALLLTLTWIAWGFVDHWSTSWLLWPSAIAGVSAHSRVRNRDESRCGSSISL